MSSNAVVTCENQSEAHELKARLEWGQPGFTILDVRDRFSFNHAHIMGAMPMPLDELSHRTSALHKGRDIYVYGADDQHTALAASILRGSGFQRVSELQGGLASWKNVGGAMEGTEV